MDIEVGTLISISYKLYDQLHMDYYPQLRKIEPQIGIRYRTTTLSQLKAMNRYKHIAIQNIYLKYQQSQSPETGANNGVQSNQLESNQILSLKIMTEKARKMKIAKMQNSTEKNTYEWAKDYVSRKSQQKKY